MTPKFFGSIDILNVVPAPHFFQPEKFPPPPGFCRPFLCNEVDIHPIVTSVPVVKGLDGVFVCAMMSVSSGRIHHIDLYGTAAEFLEISIIGKLLAIVPAPATGPGFERVRIEEKTKPLQNLPLPSILLEKSD